MKFYWQKKTVKIEKILRQADNTLILEATVKVLFYCVKEKFWCCNIAYPVQDEVSALAQLRLQVFVAPGICRGGCGI